MCIIRSYTVRATKIRVKSCLESTELIFSSQYFNYECLDANVDSTVIVWIKENNLQHNYKYVVY